MACGSRQEATSAAVPNAVQRIKRCAIGGPEKTVSLGLAIGPFDGWYAEIGEEISLYFSQYALLRNMVVIEIKWLAHYLLNVLDYDILNEDELENLCCYLEFLRDSFDLREYAKVKEIEKYMGDSVKAVDQYVTEKLREAGYTELVRFVSIGCTSEDIASAAYSMMVQETFDHCWLPAAEELVSILMSSENHKKRFLGSAISAIMSLSITECSQIVSGFGKSISKDFPKINWENEVEKEFIENHLQLTYGSEIAELKSLSKLMANLQCFGIQLRRPGVICEELYPEISDGILDGIRRASRKTRSDFYPYQSAGLAFGYLIKAIKDTIKYLKEKEN